jgi:hypothetical protein
LGLVRAGWRRRQAWRRQRRRSGLYALAQFSPKRRTLQRQDFFPLPC